MSFDTTKIDEWDLEECRDYLRHAAGWKIRKVDQDTRKVTSWCRGTAATVDYEVSAEPIPATLDEASKLPEGSFWLKIEQIGDDEFIGTVHTDKETFEVLGKTELLCRFRLRCKVESLGGLK